MIRTIILISITCCYFIFNIFPSMAQNSLSNVEIENYISSLSGVNALSKQHESEEKESPLSIKNTGEVSLTPISDALALSKHHTIFPEMQKIIFASGFSNTERWAQVGDQIMLAYSGYHFKRSSKTPKEITEGLQENLKSIKNNQYISNEQKEILIRNIEKSIALMSDPNYIDNQNIKIISPYIKRLDSLFKENQ